MIETPSLRFGLKKSLRYSGLQKNYLLSTGNALFIASRHCLHQFFSFGKLFGIDRRVKNQRGSAALCHHASFGIISVGPQDGDRNDGKSGLRGPDETALS